MDGSVQSFRILFLEFNFKTFCLKDQGNPSNGSWEKVWTPNFKSCERVSGPANIIYLYNKLKLDLFGAKKILIQQKEIKYNRSTEKKE